MSEFGSTNTTPLQRLERQWQDDCQVFPDRFSQGYWGILIESGSNPRLDWHITFLLFSPVE